MAELLGTFEQAVLLTILRLGDEAYGRAILGGVEETLRRDVSAGSVYTTLDRLETRGLVGSRLAERHAGPGWARTALLYGGGQSKRALSDARATLTAMWANVQLPIEVQP